MSVGNNEALLLACTRQANETKKSYIWNANNEICTEITETEINYFLPSGDEMTPLFPKSTTFSTETKNADVCCTMSEGTDENLLMACTAEKSPKSDTILTYN